MTTATRNTTCWQKEVDNLRLHQQMYERRLRLLKEREDFTDNNDKDGTNSTDHEEDNE
jgi:hypothetical protein